ncbi:MAG: hypothetical protein ACUVQ5_02845 [Candidatus Methanomethylicaceae archaeon]
MRSLGIFMENIKASYGLIKELRRMRVPFVLLRPADPIPDSVDVVISFRAHPQYKNRVVLYDGDPKRTILRALSASKGKEYFEDVIIGVDPGQRSGLAVLADGELLEAYTVAEECLGREIERILRDYPAGSFIFKFGKGRIPNGLFSMVKTDNRARIEIVDETKMSIPPKYNTKGLRKDAKSALTIALSGGINTKG